VSRGGSSRGSARVSPARGVSPAPGALSSRWPHERAIVLALLALHLALVGWGIARNSVTFDEHFHLPAGVAIMARGDFSVSLAQPPLVKSVCALAALAAGARVPPDAGLPPNAEYGYGELFARANADRFTRVYTAGRAVIAALSVLLALLVWRWARRLYGPRGAALSLGAYVLAPDVLAHAGIVGMDLATALGTTASLYAFWRFTRSGAWRWWAWTALALALTLLTRFSAPQIGVAFVALAAWGAATGTLRRPARVWLGLALLPLTSLLALNAGYGFHTSFAPLATWHFRSPAFQHAAAAWPALRLPIPDACVAGFDYLSSLQAEGVGWTFVLGHAAQKAYWWYVPFALALKWPLGFLGLLGLRAAHAAALRPSARRARHDAFLLLPVAVLLGVAMFVARLDVGVRYLLPLVPLLCVWLGGLAAAPARWPRAVRAQWPRWAGAAALLLAVQAVESVSAAPYELAFFNRLAGAHPDQVLNDSNVDWGQGLIALRDELARRGITRVHLAYHGTTNPRRYGIDFVPYLGGAFGPESDWFAVSSFYRAGLPQRMVLPDGRTESLVRFDLSAMRDQPEAAHLAGCMYLYRIR